MRAVYPSVVSFVNASLTNVVVPIFITSSFSSILKAKVYSWPCFDECSGISDLFKELRKSKLISTKILLQLL